MKHPFLGGGDLAHPVEQGAPMLSAFAVPGSWVRISGYSPGRNKKSKNFEICFESLCCLSGKALKKVYLNDVVTKLQSQMFENA